MKQAKVLLSLDMIKTLTQILTSFKLEKEKSWLQFGQNVKEAYQKSKTVVNPYRILKFTWIISIVYVLWFMSALSNLMEQREVFVFLSFFFFGIIIILEPFCVENKVKFCCSENLDV